MIFTCPGIYSDGAPEWAFTHLMRSTGWRCVRNGHLRRFYDLGGVLRAAYSYNACIYTRLLTQDGVRAVLNLSKYSLTTGRHQDEILSEAVGVYGRWSFSEGGELPLEARMAIDLHGLRECVSHRELKSLAVERLADYNTIEVELVL